MSWKREVLIALAALICLLLFRTWRVGDPLDVDPIELPEAPTVSANLAATHLSQALRIRTIATRPGDPHPGSEGPWLEMHRWLEETYPLMHQELEKEFVDDYTLLYTWHGSDASLLPLMLMAHQDVVPVNPGTEGDWDAPPYSGDILEGFIYGRGALDDKGSLVGIAEAIEALVASGFDPRRTIYVLFGHDEEIVQDTGAGQAVELLRSRNVRLEMVLDEGGGVVTPPPLGAGKGMAAIGVVEKGWISLQLTAVDAGGHSSTPPRNTGTVRIARAVAALDKRQMPAAIGDPGLEPTIASVGRELPLLARIAVGNLWLFGPVLERFGSMNSFGNAQLRTTTAPTMLSGSTKENVLPQRATAVINFRIHPSNTSQDVIDHVRDIIEPIGGIELEVFGEVFEPTPVSPLDSYGYRVLHSVAADMTQGGLVTQVLVAGTTDSRHTFSLTDNVYRFMPSIGSAEDGAGVHGTNERIAVSSLHEMSERYAQIVLAMDQPQGE